MKDKKFTLNPFVLIFSVITICGLLTFIVTPGVIENGVYTALPRNTFNFNNIFNIFRAVPNGLIGSVSVVVITLIVGGSLEIYKRTGAIDTSINSLVTKFGGKNGNVLLITLIVTFSAIGGFLGWIETLIPFIPLVVAVVLALGYDGITAAAVSIIGPMAGFLAGPTNLYTVGVANNVLKDMGIMDAEASVFQGVEFRVALWAVLTAVSVLYILRYASKVKSNPETSLTADVDVTDIKLDLSKVENEKMTIAHTLVLLSIFGAMALSILGMQAGIDGVKWGINDVSAIFLASGIFSGVVGKLKPSEISNAFLDGCKAAIPGGMIIGVARGVYWILEEGKINATVIYHATELLKGTAPVVAAIGILFLVSIVNGLIPSGSGKAALLTPIVVPIALSLGLTPQTSVLAYQMGDGITNMFWFTYGTLLIFLQYAKVPLPKWYKFFVPLMCIFFAIAIAAIVIAVNIGF